MDFKFLAFFYVTCHILENFLLHFVVFLECLDMLLSLWVYLPMQLLFTCLLVRFDQIGSLFNKHISLQQVVSSLASHSDSVECVELAPR